MTALLAHGEPDVLWSVPPLYKLAHVRFLVSSYTENKIMEKPVLFCGGKPCILIVNGGALGWRPKC